MGLLNLPAELRLRIYDYLPELNTTKTITIAAGNALTPHICRTTRLLRQETIPIFASNAVFAIFLAPNADPENWLSNAMTVWLNGLGELGRSKMSKLHLSRHWELSKPTRNQAHVGFYLNLERDGVRDPHRVGTNELTKWKTTVGTYPIHRDMRGMRLESAQLLQRIVVARLEDGNGDGSCTTVAGGPRSFTREDLAFIIRAIDVIARHPFSTYELNGDDDSRQRRRSVFEKMENELSLLVGGREGTDLPMTLYTPC